MITTKTKKLILFGSIAAGVLLIAAAITVLLLWPKSKPDPHLLLEEADTLTKQNLCLMALLEQQPEDTEAQKRLLANYQALDADPLTIYAAEQKFGIRAEGSTASQKEGRGAIKGSGGIALLDRYEKANEAAEGADTTYYATDDGIYADYRGLILRIAAIRAQNLIATENGLYFLNIPERRIQYLARDGHRLETISSIEAQSFAFFNEKLWIASTDGALYCEETAIETALPIRTLAATAYTLYAACDQEGIAAGVLAIDKSGKQSKPLSSPVFSIYGGTDGNLYYINAEGYPMRYDSMRLETTILAPKKAIAVSFENGAAYYLNEKGTLKKIA